MKFESDSLPEYTGIEQINDSLQAIPTEQVADVQFELNMFLARLELLKAKSLSDLQSESVDHQAIQKQVYQFLRDDLIDFLHKILAAKDLPDSFPDLKSVHKDIIKLLKELGVYVFDPPGKDYTQTTIPERWLGALIKKEGLELEQLVSFFGIYRNRLYTLSESTPYGFTNQRQYMRRIIAHGVSWNLSFVQVFRGELLLRDEIIFALLRRFSPQNRLNYLIAKDIISKLSENFIESLHVEVESYFQRLVKVQRWRNSRLQAEGDSIRQEVKTAARLQSKSIQSDLPADTALVQFRIHYQPFMSLSGDFYRITKISDHEYSLLLCDIAGHGLGAAMYYNTLVNSFEKYERFADRPDKLLQRMNKNLYGKLNDNFVTAICVYINLNKNRLVYCNAGHPKAFLLSHGEAPVRVRFLRPNAKILGVFRDIPFNTKKLEWVSASRLVLYTDGLSELFNESNEMLGERGLLELFKENANQKSEPTIERVNQKLTAYQGTKSLQDDRTMILVDIRPAGASEPSVD